MLIPVLFGLGLFILLTRTAKADHPGASVNTPSVQSWRSKFLELGPDVPIDVALAWIAEESGGRPCDIGETPHQGATRPQEYGLSQLNYEDPADRAIATPEKLRGPSSSPLCGMGPSRGEWTRQLRPLTEGEKYTHAAAAISHMRRCRDEAAKLLGSPASKIDPLTLWSYAKTYHAGSAVAKLLTPIKEKLGRNPSWQEFKEIATHIMLANGKPQGYIDRVWTNAEAVRNSLLKGTNS